MGSLKNQADYSKYKCPYAHIEKECGHKLVGPEGYENAYEVWCACGFRGPSFCLEPDELGFELKMIEDGPLNKQITEQEREERCQHQQATISKLVKALEYYADKRIYETLDGGDMIYNDNGKIADKALADHRGKA